MLIFPSQKEELRVDKLTMVFNCPGWNVVGTTIDPNVPDGISKMFVFHFIFYIFVFYLFCYGFQFFFFLEFFFLLGLGIEDDGIRQG
jgi:hypothetical protein